MKASTPLPAADKLAHVVGKYLSGLGSPMGLILSPNVDAAVEFLLKNYPEYKRQDADHFKQSVAAAISKRQGLSSSSSPSSQSSGSGAQPLTSLTQAKKRPLDHPPPQSSPHASSASDLMNASQRDKYHKQQKATSSSSASAAASAAASSSSPLSSSSSATAALAPPPPPSSDSSASAANGAAAERRRKSKGLSSSPFPSSSSSDSTSSGLNTLASRPTVRYSDLGGVESILQSIRELIEYPLSHPEVYAHLGVEPPRGVLLHGPPGCGKTLLANAMAGQLGVSFLKISAPEIVSAQSGESEQKVREVFQMAVANAPAILFIDEVDAIMSKRDSSARGMEKRIVAQLLTCMDNLSMENTGGKPVMVIGATNRPDSIDSALRRAGRFDREICLGVPDEKAREKILRVMTDKMKLEGGGGPPFDFAKIAKLTPGYVGADIRSLTKEAAVIAINRIFKDVLGLSSSVAGGGGSDAAKVTDDPMDRDPLSSEQMEGLSVTMDDFLRAVKIVQPSSKREGFATVPDVTWADIGALESIRGELTLSIIEPIQCPERFEQLGLSMPAGVLLYGPPGCGKTLLAKAIAAESGANFISVKGPELLDKYVGESERAVRQVFERARASSPCVIFFDELDSLCPRRGQGGDGGGGVSERVVNQLLTELDGLDARKSVFVVAATNRPELIDPAMLRPGRLDKLLYVPLPSPDDRASILRAISKKAAIDPEVDLAALAKSERANGYSGADMAALLREAGLACLKEAGKGVVGEKLRIEARHFDRAFENIRPSVSKEDQTQYDTMRERISRARSRA